MSLIKQKTAWNKVDSFALNMKECKGIYSISEFKEVVKYERIRSDRSNSIFSIILFNSNEIYNSGKNLCKFIKELKRQVRLIDHLGWYDHHHIAAVLPETGRKGAAVLAVKVINHVDFIEEKLISFQIYTYPDNWLDKCDKAISVRSSDDRKKQPEFNSHVENRFTIKMPLWKRLLDITLGSVGILIASPIFIFLPLYIKFVSPGPVFFHQSRVGFKGREFCFWKFRTMHADNRQSFHGKHAQSFIKNGDIPMEKLDDRDPRIIPGGRVLRKACIDELPQLWNVLKGDMSLVGPRPCIPYEAAEYLRWHTHRFDVVPGLTGLWQVSGKNKLTFKQMIRLDIAYSNNLSLLIDLWIISKTPYAIVKMVSEATVKRISGHHIENASNGVLPEQTGSAM